MPSRPCLIGLDEPQYREIRRRFGGPLVAYETLPRIIVRDGRGSGEATMLSGSLSEISLPTLLSLLEFERKSGILLVLASVGTARLFVAEGRIVKVECGDPAHSPRERLMTVLDWVHGHFEFTSCEVIGSDEIGSGTTSLLLEHARIRDESRRT